MNGGVPGTSIFSTGEATSPLASAIPSASARNWSLATQWQTTFTNKVGSDDGYHYLGSAITFSKIGRAFGQAMLELMGAEK
jgi:hypothetical protein